MSARSSTCLCPRGGGEVPVRTIAAASALAALSLAEPARAALDPAALPAVVEAEDRLAVPEAAPPPGLRPQPRPPEAEAEVEAEGTRVAMLDPGVILHAQLLPEGRAARWSEDWLAALFWLGFLLVLLVGSVARIELRQRRLRRHCARLSEIFGA